MQYKARLVVKRYNQNFGTDYDETFAPVVKHTTIRAFLTAEVYKRMCVKHMDIKTAFLHGDLYEDIYMKHPEGYTTSGEEQKSCKLKKSLYGLQQAAKAWKQTTAEVLQLKNFQQSIADICLFTKEEKEDNSEYRQAIGALLYISTVSRPDVSLTVNKLGRRNEIPTEKDWTALKKLIMYLNTTNHVLNHVLNHNFNLVINNMSPPVLTYYTDADWASYTSTRNKWKCLSYRGQPHFLVFENTELHHTFFLRIRVYCSAKTVVVDTSLERP
ncbi:retrovirus-related Pol polyprotein from transposon TNT 1-94 [Nephila pilipes]|uniref:Retrovirus-related Pol polyprotein from transposon TNT 1-94 n=1 Tax=Nephila pilipes TaxID=299642 RepID=A0A8X6R4T0_NEPPI|nr:retrovirus-related Pol polyprotein from transposon TNT 1-94 [Nephila pilipes]